MKQWNLCLETTPGLLRNCAFTHMFGTSPETLILCQQSRDSWVGCYFRVVVVMATNVSIIREGKVSFCS